MRGSLQQRGIGMALALTLALVNVGCDKATAANFEQVQIGMSQSRVEELMGAGTDDTSHAGVGTSSTGMLSGSAPKEKVLIWKSAEGTVYRVVLVDGKVVEKGTAAP